MIWIIIIIVKLREKNDVPDIFIKNVANIRFPNIFPEENKET